MGGFFGTIAKEKCVNDLFYGTDYNSHMGTKRGGMATYSPEDGFKRSIHNLESSYFRSKFEDDLDKFSGNAGIGVISDTDPQPIMMNSHLGKFAIVTVARIANIAELEKDLLDSNMHFSELSSGKTNQTELIALLIIQGRTFREGIENVFARIKGSCSMLILTEDGIIAARDRLGRTPIVIGRKGNEAYAATSESCSFPNLGYETERYMGPGEILKLYPDHVEQIDRHFRCGFCLRHSGFRYRPGTRICRRERHSVSQGDNQIYSHMAQKFHSEQPGAPLSCSQDETHPEQGDARREKDNFLR